MGDEMRRRSFVVLFTLVAVCALAIAAVGCGGGSTTPTDPTGGRPKSVSAYEAAQYTQPAADKWQSTNWMIQLRDGDADGLDRDGKAKIWEVYYFSPTPEVNTQMFVIYNRGNVWPNAPGISKGGDKGLEIYRKGKPPAFRVDSPEALTVARQNGGGEYLDAHPNAKPNCMLRCKADYDAVGQAMPAPNYKWIWDVYYKEANPNTDVLHIYVDGMNGDFITKEIKKSS
jgi:hypothetical protein